jgi:hypothetical protein
MADMFTEREPLPREPNDQLFDVGNSTFISPSMFLLLFLFTYLFLSVLIGIVASLE